MGARTEEELRAIAKKHVDIPDDVDIHIVEHLPEDTTASYGTFRKTEAGYTSWSDIALNGRVKISFKFYVRDQ